MKNLFTELKQETVTEYQKSQLIRLIDVLLIGPVLIYSGFREQNVYLKAGLIIIGILTILYNAKNYIKNVNTNKF